MASLNVNQSSHTARQREHPHSESVITNLTSSAVDVDLALTTYKKPLVLNVDIPLPRLESVINTCQKLTLR